MKNLQPADFASRIKHLRESLGLSQQAFGDPIDFSQAHISDIEAGKKAPSPKLVRAVCRKYGVAEQWLRNGAGEAEVKEVRQPEQPYDLHGGWEPRSIEEMAGVPRGLGMGKAVDLLGRIYATKSETLIRAAYSNLDALCRVIEDRDRGEEELARLAARIAELEKLVAAGGCAWGRHDRRTGQDRRVAQTPGFPPEQDRRTGTDRRDPLHR